MPYIKQDNRGPFLKGLETLPNPTNAGELNYLITLIVHRYLNYAGKSYQSHNDAIGALEGVKLELYRRKTAPYEDAKITQNGDV